MQRGGFDILPLKDSDFKYTQSQDRILWTKNVFPIGHYIADAVMKIPWKKYSYQGSCNLWKDNVDVEESNSYTTFTRKAGTPTYVKETIPLFAKYESSPGFYFFGGSVYELMNTLYRNEADLPDLHSYVDPTGDLDIIVIPPTFNTTDEYDLEEYKVYFFESLQPSTNASNIEPQETQGCVDQSKNYNAGNRVVHEVVTRDSRRYNNFLDHFTSWIMDQFATNIKNMKKGTLFSSLFGNTVPFNLENDAEGRFADSVICIDNIKIVRSFLPYMSKIKIQLIAKFTGMTRSDHICEFLIHVPNNVDDYMGSLNQYTKNHDSDYLILKGIPMSNFKELINGNMDAMKNRFGFYKDPKYRHKFYNHVGRMLYLQKFLKRKVNRHDEKDPKKITLKFNDYQQMGYAMTYFAYYIFNVFSETILHLFDYKIAAKMKKLGITIYGSYWEDEEEQNVKMLKRLIGIYPYFLLKKQYGIVLSAVGTQYIDTFRDANKYKYIFQMMHILRYSPTYEQNRVLAKSLGLDYDKQTFSVSDIFILYHAFRDLPFQL